LVGQAQARKYTRICNIAAMKKVTVTLGEKTAARARVRAAERKMSLSRYIGEVLRKELRHADEYEAAYRAWRDRKPWPLKGPPQPYPKREELYDRPVLRRR
jgi:hypothetical protein